MSIGPFNESSTGLWYATEDQNPAQLGLYNCRILSTSWPEQRLQWDGEEWRMHDGKPMHLYVSHWCGPIELANE